MARLRFPGRPGYRFDRIGVRYGADEARQTTDPSLAVVASIHKGLQRFRDLFGDSDEDEEFHGFTSADVKSAERQLIKYQQAEREFLTKQAQKEDRDRLARSQAALASFAAAAEVSVGTIDVSLDGAGRAKQRFGKTFKQILDTGLVQNVPSLPTKSAGVGRKKKSSKVTGAEGIEFKPENAALMQQNGIPVRERVTSLKHVKLKRLTHTVDGQVVFRRPVGRPRKNPQLPAVAGEASFVNGEAVGASHGTRPSAKYRSAAQQLLARATKLHHSNVASLSSTAAHKARKFVLPTKSSRSSRVIKPNKRFLEDGSVHAAIMTSADSGENIGGLAEADSTQFNLESPSTLSMLLPSSSGDAPLRKSIFGMEVGEEKPGLGGSSTFSSSPFLHHSPGGLASLSPFNLNREKGFPAFSAAPQPSGTTSFTDKSQFLTSGSGLKPLGALDQPLIVEGKRPRKPSLIMRMKLVEDDPEDEIRLQQSLLADSASPPKSSVTSLFTNPSSTASSSASLKICEVQLTDDEIDLSAVPSSSVHGYGTTKSLIAPAKLFTGSASSSSSKSKFSKSRRQKLKSVLLPAQQTVVLRQAKLQLNRAALNRSKAALARSLKATLKREAKLERRKRFSLRKLRKSSNISAMPPLEGSDASAVSGLLALSNAASVPALSPNAASKLSQLSPFSLQMSGAMVERSKQGLFQSMDGGHSVEMKVEPLVSSGLAPPSTSTPSDKPPATTSSTQSQAASASSSVPKASVAAFAHPSSTSETDTAQTPMKTGKRPGRKPKPKLPPGEEPEEFMGELNEGKLDEYFESLVNAEDLLAEYHVGEKGVCLVCSSWCRIMANRKLPKLPLCKPCKKAYFFQLSKGDTPGRPRKCSSKRFPNKCGPENFAGNQNYCPACKYRRFCGVLRRAKKLGVEARLWTKDYQPAKEPRATVKWKDFIRKGPKKVKLSSSEPESDFETTPKKRPRNKSGDSGSEGAFYLGKAAQRGRHRSLSGGGSDYARQQDMIHSKNLDQPLSVDVGDTSGSFTLSPPQTVSSTKSSPGKSSRTPNKKHGQDNTSDIRRSRGPRIKHVCRRAAMVFPGQRATFPGDGLARNGPCGGKGLSAGGGVNVVSGGGPTLTLSALPNEEKQQVLARTKMKKEFEKYSSSDDSEEERKPRHRLNSSLERKHHQASVKKERKFSLSSPSPMKENAGSDVKDEDGLLIDCSDDGVGREAARGDLGDGKVKKMKSKTKLQKGRHRYRSYKKRARRLRCRKCTGCLTPECGNCISCRDKPKYGGKGIMKKPCIHSMCLNLRKVRQATDAFIEPKSPEKFRRPDNNDDDNSGGYNHSSLGNGGHAAGQMSRVTGKSNGGDNDHSEMNGGKGDGAKDAVDADSEMYTDSDSDDDDDRPKRCPTTPQQVKRGLDMDGSQVALNFQRRRAAGVFGGSGGGGGVFGRLPKVSATVQLALSDHRLGRGLAKRIAAAEAAFVGKMRKKKEKKQEMFKLKPVETETAYSMDVPLKKHLIKADYQEEYDVETAWLQGYSLTVTGPSCVRTLCFLCGSAGKHQMIFCIVCCQSFHNFCLEEEERPEEVVEEGAEGPVGKELYADTTVATGAEDEGEEGHNNHSSSSAVTQHRGSTSSGTLSWCCRRCQFCHVCGQQNGLLKCHRCRDTYHPECLGPNYPTKPSRKNIWVCTKCVRCKSCGATTPGVGTNATWTYDFSLCHECGKLMDKGNFCPICHKCYSDDDWESKMIQCSGCESWVHAKCEELTDEMYQLIACLPDDIHYRCRVCAARDSGDDSYTSASKGHTPLSQSSYWQKILHAQLVRGLLNVTTSLLMSKCTQVLQEAANPPTWSRRPKTKAVESSKTVTVKEVGRPGADGQSPCNLPQTVTVNLDAGDTAAFDDSLVLKSSSSCSLIGASPSKSPALSTSGCLMDVTAADNRGGDAPQVETSNQTTEGNLSHYHQNSPAAHLMASAPPDSNFVSNFVENHSFNNSVKCDLGEGIGERVEEEGREVESRASFSESQTPNNLIVCLDSDEEEPFDNEEPQTKSIDLESVISAAQSTSSDNLGVSTNLCLTSNSPMDMLANSSPVNTCSLPHSPRVTPTLVNRLSTTDNGIQRQRPQLSALLTGKSQTSSSIPATSFNVNLDRGAVTKTLFQDNRSNAEELVATERIPSSTTSTTFSSDPVTTTTSCSPSASEHPTTTPVEPMATNSEILSSFYSEFQKFIFNKPSVMPASTSSSESSLAIPLDNQANVPTVSSSNCSDDLPETQEDREAQAKTITSSNNISGNSAVTLSVPSPQAGCSPEPASQSSSSTVMTMQAVEETPTKNALAVAGLSVSFDTSAKDDGDGSKNGEFPTDFWAVREKVGAGSYSTVEEFSEDMVRIIQALLFKNQNYPTRRKQANSVRSIFIKQMERIFPWFNVNTCKLWDHNRGLPEGMLRDAVLPPSLDHTYAQWLERQIVPMNPQPSPFKKNSTPQRRSSEDTHSDGRELSVGECMLSPDLPQEADDTRCCLLCGGIGDDKPDHSGRLLYCGQDDWVHINCALWSAEVFEELDGSLQNVMETVNRGKKLRCDLCQEVGATVGCCATNCRANYHFMCARRDGCMFQDNRMVYCKHHPEFVDSELIQPGQFAILRRVCVDLNKTRAKTPWGKAVDPSTLSVLIGSCTIESLGVLKSYLSDTEDCLLPIDFCCTRIYWSTQDARRRCVYTFRIVEVKPSDLDSPGGYIEDMRVVHDPAHPDFVPLEQLGLEHSGVPNLMRSKLEPDRIERSHLAVTSTSVLYVDTPNSTTMCCTTTTSLISRQTLTSLDQQGGGNRNKRALSWSHSGEHDTASPSSFIVDPDNPFGEVSPWPDKNEKLGALSSASEASKPPPKKPRTMDLSCLSPSTLALLNIKDPKQYVPSSSKCEKASVPGRAPVVARTAAHDGDEELGLVKIAERLNKAASLKPKLEKKRRSSTSPLATGARRREGVLLPSSSYSGNSCLPRSLLPPLQENFAHDSSNVEYRKVKHQFQQQQLKLRGQSLSPLTVMPRPDLRPRSSSEESQRGSVPPYTPSSFYVNTPTPLQKQMERPMQKTRKVIIVMPPKSTAEVSTAPSPSQNVISTSSTKQPPARPKAAYRARSQSPFTVISTLATGPKIHDFRSSSLSPPPVTRGPGFSLLARSGPSSNKPRSSKSEAQPSAALVEISDSDNDGNVSDENLDDPKRIRAVSPPRGKVSFGRDSKTSEDGKSGENCVEKSVESGHSCVAGAGQVETIKEGDKGNDRPESEEDGEVLSSESIQSLLENVPQEVLEGEEDVQLVVLPPGATEGLSEEDVVKLAQSVVSGGEEEEGNMEASGPSVVASEGLQDIRGSEERGCDGIHGCGESDDSDGKTAKGSSPKSSHDGTGETGNDGENSECGGVHGCGENKGNAREGFDSPTQIKESLCDGVHGCGEEEGCDSEGDDGTSSRDSTNTDNGENNNGTHNNNDNNQNSSATPTERVTSTSSGEHSSLSTGGPGPTRGGGSGRRPDGSGDGGDKREPWDSRTDHTAKDKAEDSAEENASSEKHSEDLEEEESEAVKLEGTSVMKKSSCGADQGDEVDGKVSSEVNLCEGKMEEANHLHPKKVSGFVEENSESLTSSSVCVTKISVDGTMDGSGISHSQPTNSSRTEFNQRDNSGAEASCPTVNKGDESEVELARGDIVDNNKGIFPADVSAVSIAEETPTEEEEEGELEIIDLSDSDTAREAAHNVVRFKGDAASIVSEALEAPIDISDIRCSQSEQSKSFSPEHDETPSHLNLSLPQNGTENTLPLDLVDSAPCSTDRCSTSQALPEVSTGDKTFPEFPDKNERRNETSQEKKKKKHRYKVYVNRQDMTDEDSDYHMLEDFSYSETTTNDGEEEGQSGPSSAEAPPLSASEELPKTVEDGPQEQMKTMVQGSGEFKTSSYDMNQEVHSIGESGSLDAGKDNNNRQTSGASDTGPTCPITVVLTTSNSSVTPTPSQNVEQIENKEPDSIKRMTLEKPSASPSGAELNPCLGFEKQSPSKVQGTEGKLPGSLLTLVSEDRVSSVSPVDEDTGKLNEREGSSSLPDTLCTTKPVTVNVVRMSKPELLEYVSETDLPEQADTGSASDHLSESERTGEGPGSHRKDELVLDRGNENREQSLSEIVQNLERKKVEHGYKSCEDMMEPAQQVAVEKHSVQDKCKDAAEERVISSPRREACKIVEGSMEGEAVVGTDHEDPHSHGDNKQELTNEDETSAEPILPNSVSNFKTEACDLALEEDPGVVREKMLEKIKAEGLARSGPGEEGPFKCPTCKRLYRTCVSYDAHVKDCDFELSTTDEDESNAAPVAKRELRSSKRKPDTMENKAPDVLKSGQDVKEKAASSTNKMDVISECESEKETFERMRKERKGTSLSPLNEPLSIIISDEFREGSASSKDRDLSDDCSSQDSRRSSLRRSTVTQRNAAPAHLAKQRHRDSLSKFSSDGSAATSPQLFLLSPKGGKSSSMALLEEKPSPKETMLEAVGLVSKRTLELSPNSDTGAGGVCNIEPGSSGGEQTCAVRLQPRFSPTTMAVVPKREKRSCAMTPLSSGPLALANKPSIMAGGKVPSTKPELDSPRIKSVSIVSNPVVVNEVSIGPAKKPRKKRIWWVEATESEEEDDAKEMEEDPLAGIDDGVVARRTRHGRQRLSEEGTESKRSQRQDVETATTDSAEQAVKGTALQRENQADSAKSEHSVLGDSRREKCDDDKSSEEESPVHVPTLRSRRRSSAASNSVEDLRAKSLTSQREADERDIGSKKTRKREVDGVAKNADEVDSGDQTVSLSICTRRQISGENQSARKDDDDRKFRELESEESDRGESDEEKDSALSQTEDDRKSPIRRSGRPSSKTARLSEFLAKLKKEKEGQENLLSPIVSPEKRGRGRPRLCPLKDQSVPKRGRGRPRLRPRPNDDGGKDLNMEVSDKGSKTSLLSPAEVSDKDSKTSLLSPAEVSDQDSKTSLLSPAEVSDQDSKTSLLSPAEVSDKDSKTFLLSPSPRALRSRSHIENDEGSVPVEDDGDENDGSIEDGGEKKNENNEEKDAEGNGIVNEIKDTEKDLDNVEQDIEFTESRSAAGKQSDSHTAVSTKALEPETVETDDSAPDTTQPSKPNPAVEAVRGQRLRIIVRSPNVLAAQKVGELIKQTAQCVNPNTSDVTITTDDKSKMSDTESASKVVTQSGKSDKTSLSRSVSEQDLNAESKADSDGDLCSRGSKAENETTQGESRSVSPQSVSAAYDIQSDDFSSETSNDTEDFVPRTLTGGIRKEEQEEVSHMETNPPNGPQAEGRRVSVLPLKLPPSSSSSKLAPEKENNNQVFDDDDDDDDVVLVKAVGLQPPDPHMAKKQTVVIQQQNSGDCQEPTFTIKPVPTPVLQFSSPPQSSSSAALTNILQHTKALVHSQQQQQRHASIISTTIPSTAANSGLAQTQLQGHIVSDLSHSQPRFVLQQQNQLQLQTPTLSPPQVPLAQAGRIVLQNHSAQSSSSVRPGRMLQLSASTSPVQSAGTASGLIFPNPCPSGIALNSQPGLALQATANQSGIPLQAVNQSGIPLQGASQSGIPLLSGANPAGGISLQAVSPSGITFQTASQSGLALQRSSPQGLTLQTSQGGLTLQTGGQQGGGPILVGQSSPATGGVVLGPGQTAHLQGLVQGPVNPGQAQGLSIISTILSPLQALHQPQGQASQMPQGSPTVLPGMAALGPLVGRTVGVGGGARVGDSSPPDQRHLIIGQQPRVLLSQQQLQQQQLQIQYQQQQQKIQQQQQQHQQQPRFPLSQHLLDRPPQLATPGTHSSPHQHLTSSMSSAQLLSSLASQSATSGATPGNLTGVRIAPVSSAQPMVAGVGPVPPHTSSAQHLTPVPMSSAPQLTHVDGTPAQVNYMGTFDLNSSTLQAVMSGQGITQNTTQMIKDLVQRALRSGGREVIPGVEVKSAITDTPQGPKKVLRVFINEDILPIQRGSLVEESPIPQPALLPSSSSQSANASPLSSQPPTTSHITQQQIGFSSTPNIAAVAAASLQPLRRSLPSTPSGHQDSQEVPTPQHPPSSNTLPNWTKLLQPKVFPAYESKTLAADKNSSNNLTTPTTSPEQQQHIHKNLKPQAGVSGSNFRRALKPAIHAPLLAQHKSAIKRKQQVSENQDSSVSVANKKARAVFEKTRLEDGSYAGRLGGLVNRSLELSAPVTTKVGDGSIQNQEDRSITASCPTLLSALQPNKGASPLVSASCEETLSSSFTSKSSLQSQPEAVIDQTSLSSQHPEPVTTTYREQHSTPDPHHNSHERQQLSPLQRASFPPPAAGNTSHKSQHISQVSKTRIRKHLVKKSGHRKDSTTREPGAPRGKGMGKKAGQARKTKLAVSHHRLIHHNKKSGELLPQPTLEEEVVATPFDLLSKGDHPGGGRGGRGGRGFESSQSHLRFEISSDDGFSCQGDSMEDAWNQVLEKVQDVRAACRMKQLSYAGVSGCAMSGLENNSVVYLLEQLYGAVHCHQNYKFRFHKYDLDQADAEVAINDSGSARSEAFSTRKPFDMFNFLKSVYRTRPGDEERDKEEEMSLKSSRRATSLSLPMAMRFRKLKTFAKEAVDVYRSKIHGRGLFCKRNIDAGEMVIEYAGEVIRASLTDKREKYYEGKGIGCYMFRIDDDEVVDATMHGSAARFINHSCEPNCFSKVILVEGKKHIVIFAMRPIKRGEELTYDYKFPIEEVKIPCSCGSRRCRKYLN